jgi:O-antigen/teichoic acid export membrane protein
MSTAARLISGSTAQWMRMGILLISQIALVPLYLNFWSVETYGVWLAIQALIAIITMIDFGHQTYLGYEFLRLANTNKNELSKNLWSGVIAGCCIGMFQIVLILILIYSNALPGFLGMADLGDPDLVSTASVVLLLQGAVWLVCTSVSGLFVRTLEPFGYFPRLSWWGVLVDLVKNFSPAIAVVLGADLLVTGVVLATATIAINVPIYFDMFRLMRRIEIGFSRPSFKLAYKNFLRSTAVVGKLILENARQQGVRLVLAPLSGVAALAAFSTMRTASNVALQGLNTITNPLMPDLMRFLHSRDQVRSEAAFGTVWVVVVALMAPAVVILQVFISPLFNLWTQGRIVFEPALFSILSLTVLIYAVTQPAMAVVMGNNLTRQQLLLSGLAAIVVIGGILVLVPSMGIQAAGVALLIAEIVSSIGYTIFAKKWLAKNSLTWPMKSFAIAITSVLIAAISMACMIVFPEAKWIIFAVTQLFFAWNFWRYWLVLPSVFTRKVLHIASRFPGMKRVFQLEQFESIK